MAKFCVYCGGPLNPDGSCPKCARAGTVRRGAAPAEKTEARPEASRVRSKPSSKGGAAKKPASKRKKKSPALPIVLITLAVLILAFITLCALQYFKVVNIPFMGKLLQAVGLQKEAQTEEETDAYGWNDDTPPSIVSENTVQRPDALETMKQIGTVVSQTSISASTTLETGAEAYSELRSRGFTQYPITASYGEDGSFSREEQEVSAVSGEKHPIYETFYVTSDGAAWTIMSINGKIIANPLSWNADEYWQTMHLVSETNTFIQFDGATKTFIEVVPNPSEVYIKTVARIDAATLEGLTVEEVDN